MACLDQATKPLPQHALEHLVQSCTLAAHLTTNSTLNDTEKRSHSYINLQLPLPFPNGTLKRTVKLNPVPPTSVETAPKQEVTSGPNGSGNYQPNPEGAVLTSNIDQNEDGQDDESHMQFCWSPRFPPDGAACYENSPPSSCLPLPPVAKFDREPDLPNLRKEKWPSLANPFCAHEVDGPPRICHGDSNNPPSSTHFSTAVSECFQPPSATHQTTGPFTTHNSEISLSHVLCISPADLISDQGATETGLIIPTRASGVITSFKSTSIPTISNPSATTGCDSKQQETVIRMPITSGDNPKQEVGSDCNAQSRPSSFSVLKPNACRATSSTTIPEAYGAFVPLKFNRCVSLPKPATLFATSDGRTVVPWCLGTRELPDNFISSKTLAEEEFNFLTGFVSASSSFYDSSPQWVRPDHLSPIEHLSTEGSRKLRRHRSHGQAVKSRLVLASDKTPTHTISASKEHAKHLTDDLKTHVSGVLPLSRTVSCRSERGPCGSHVESNIAISHPDVRSATVHRQFCATGCRNLHSDSTICEGKGTGTASIACSAVEAEVPTIQPHPDFTLLGQDQGRPIILTRDRLFYKHLSAGSSFGISSKKPGSSPSGNLPLKPDTTRPLPPSSSGTLSVSTATYGRRRHTADELATVHPKSLPASTGCSGKCPNLPASDSHRLLNSSLLATDLGRIGWHSGRSASEMSNFNGSGLTHGWNYGDPSIPGFSSTMTRSVLSPIHLATSPCQGTSPKPKQALSASGRRRHCKTGSARSHSQRKVDEFDACPLADKTALDHFGHDVSAENRRCITRHTVPLQSSDAGGSWPTVLAQWHHRKNSTNSMEGYRVWTDEQVARDHLRTKSRRSFHNLFSHESGKLAAPHRHSASAIFECLDRELWFHADLSRANAESLLKSARTGSFLVRQSETNKSEYSLSIRRESDVLHMKISRDPSSGQYVLGEYSQPYPSISAMIYRYTRSLLPVRGTTPILLRFPVDRKVSFQATS